MANSNVSPTSTTSTLSFVPRIVMMATYTQYTQMPITFTSFSFIQTDRQTLNTTSTQTKTFQTTQATQTSPQQNSQAIQTDHMLNEILPLDSSDSSTSTDVLMKWLCQSTGLTQTEREKVIKTTILITSLPPNKERKFFARSTKLFKTFGQ